jgi:hypothetical protein
MGVPKGKDNFKAFRASKQKSAQEILHNELEKARRRKMTYPDKATLVSDMAERTKLHRTTLVRNPVYHRVLLEFLATQAGGSTFVSDNDASPELLRAKLIDAKLEIGSLRKQLADIGRNEAGNPRGIKPQGLRLTESAAHAAFSDTVWALREVLDRVNVDGEVFEVDLNRCEIRDLAAAPGRRVVMAGQRLRPFIEALRTLKEQEK